jgi:hypothetical protein
MSSHLWWVHAHYSPKLVEWWTCVSSPLLSHTPHRRSTGGSNGATQRGVRFDLGGVSQLTFWCQGWILDPVIFIFYFVSLPLCNKYSNYCDIYLYTLCYYICCLLWRMYEMHPALSLKARVLRSWRDSVVHPCSCSSQTHGTSLWSYYTRNLEHFGGTWIPGCFS